jgi:hypothetical protein
MEILDDFQQKIRKNDNLSKMKSRLDKLNFAKFLLFGTMGKTFSFQQRGEVYQFQRQYKAWPSLVFLFNGTVRLDIFHDWLNREYCFNKKATEF